MSSATRISAMRPCPKCKKTGVVEINKHWWTCPLCGGDKYVSHFKLVEWELEAVRHFTPAPDTEPDPNKEPDQ